MLFVPPPLFYVDKKKGASVADVTPVNADAVSELKEAVEVLLLLFLLAGLLFCIVSSIRPGHAVF